MQDLQLCDIAGIEQVWTRDGWVDRFGLDLPRDDHGYGHGPDEVGKVRAPADLLAGYYHAVHKVTLEYIASVTAEELSRVVDTHWTPPVTASARLVSIIDDCAQHLGQAAYVRGIAPEVETAPAAAAGAIAVAAMIVLALEGSTRSTTGSRRSIACPKLSPSHGLRSLMVVLLYRCGGWLRQVVPLADCWRISSRLRANKEGRTRVGTPRWRVVMGMLVLVAGGAWAVLAAVTVALAMIGQGVTYHYFTDTVGALLLGTSIAALIAQRLDRCQPGAIYVTPGG